MKALLLHNPDNVPMILRTDLVPLHRLIKVKELILILRQLRIRTDGLRELHKLILGLQYRTLLVQWNVINQFHIV